MKAFTIVKYVFTLIGLGLLVIAFFTWSGTRHFIAQAVSVQGTVVDMEKTISRDSSGKSSTSYSPIVAFKDQHGETIQFTSSSGSNPPAYSRGDAVDVLYEPSRPQDASINSFASLWAGTLIAGILGAVFFLIGVAFILVPRLKNSRNNKLKTTGTPVGARFEGVKLNRMLSVNGRNPFVIESQWLNPATNEIHVFTSDNLWFDPSGYINPEQPVTVYIERDNPRKYYVDLSFLPKLAN